MWHQSQPPQNCRISAQALSELPRAWHLKQHQTVCHYSSRFQDKDTFQYKIKVQMTIGNFASPKLNSDKLHLKKIHDTIIISMRLHERILKYRFSIQVYIKNHEIFQNRVPNLKVMNYFLRTYLDACKFILSHFLKAFKRNVKPYLIYHLLVMMCT